MLSSYLYGKVIHQKLPDKQFFLLCAFSKRYTQGINGAKHWWRYDVERNLRFWQTQSVIECGCWLKLINRKWFKFEIYTVWLIAENHSLTSDICISTVSLAKSRCSSFFNLCCVFVIFQMCSWYNKRQWNNHKKCSHASTCSISFCVTMHSCALVFACAARVE